MGDTLLHYAAHKKMFKLIDYLLEQQADPYVKNHVFFKLNREI